MKHYFKSLSLRAEFSIVIIFSFGFFIVSSLLSLFIPYSSAPISESHLVFLLFYETVVIIALWKFLSLRGWRTQHLGLVPSVRDTLIGFGLFLLAYITYLIVWLISSSIITGLEEQSRNLVSSGLSLTTVILVSILNPVFEELFVCGYIITALRKTRTRSFAINISLGIRLAYHLYQGPVGVIGIIPLGFIFAYWYAKTGRLWPVVIAHALIDFLGLLTYTQME